MTRREGSLIVLDRLAQTKVHQPRCLSSDNRCHVNRWKMFRLQSSCRPICERRPIVIIHEVRNPT